MVSGRLKINLLGRHRAGQFFACLRDRFDDFAAVGETLGESINRVDQLARLIHLGFIFFVGSAHRYRIGARSLGVVLKRLGVLTRIRRHLLHHAVQVFLSLGGVTQFPDVDSAFFGTKLHDFVVQVLHGSRQAALAKML